MSRHLTGSDNPLTGARLTGPEPPPRMGFRRLEPSTIVSVYAPVLDNVWKAIEAAGMDPAPMFKAEGVSHSVAGDPTARVPFAVAEKIRARAARESGNPAIGLFAAHVLHPSQLGALGYAWLASRSIRMALERLQRHGRMINDHAHFTLADVNGETRVGMSLAYAPDHKMAWPGAGQACMVQMCRFSAGESFTPTRVTFMIPEPDDPGPFNDYFGCELVFDAPHGEMRFDIADVDRALPTGNPQLSHMMDQVAVKYLAQHDKEDILNRAYFVITEQLPSGNVTDESVAEALHMTPRTLHRRLSDEDTNFRNVLNEVRQELAEQYINDPTITLTEISFLLGFSEVSAFSRAFRRWTGKPPSEARAGATVDGP